MDSIENQSIITLKVNAFLAYCQSFRESQFRGGFTLGLITNPIAILD
ncbi:hypothetical protein ADICYQ_4349 [Cyclobacterium qasimii M12-11B]|uniref:Uncharacterized protein n=1 Tax=Cyclobacterium qasimii M12-11B TaxID=641524 RepID=S7VAK3_9BACT|nr:hypothetical protein ADICYQ_4349 [Cyclobacterium qasimii M12-11B]